MCNDAGTCSPRRGVASQSCTDEYWQPRRVSEMSLNLKVSQGTWQLTNEIDWLRLYVGSLLLRAFKLLFGFHPLTWPGVSHFWNDEARDSCRISIFLILGFF